PTANERCGSKNQRENDEREADLFYAAWHAQITYCSIRTALTRLPTGSQPRQCRAFVHRYVIGLKALDHILRFFLRRVMHVTLESLVGHALLADPPAPATRLRVPLDPVAPPEVLRHEERISNDRTEERSGYRTR